MELNKNNNNGKSDREKRNKRKETLEKRKAIDELVKAASVHDKDHLVAFPPFRHYNRNGLSVYLDSVRGDKLSFAVKRYIQELLKNCMGGVVLTVQKANLSALNFYISKLGYIISSISPSRVDPLDGAGKSYEILCKAFDHEAKATLEAKLKA